MSANITYLNFILSNFFPINLGFSLSNFNVAVVDLAYISCPMNSYIYSYPKDFAVLVSDIIRRPYNEF